MTGTVPARFFEQADRRAAEVALRVLEAGGAASDREITWREWARDARRFAAACVAAGRAPGERVAVLAGNRPLWPVADVGTLSAGLVSVGLPPGAAPEQVRGLLEDCGATIAVVDTAERLDKVLTARAELPRLRAIVYRDGSADSEGIVGWDEWLARGERALGNGVSTELGRRMRAAVPDDTAALVYTSGSTGEPKGAMLSHRYLLASATSIRDVLGLTGADSALSFLPYCHAAERVFGLYTRVLCGMECGLVADPGRVWAAARAYGPTVFGGVPRFFERVCESLGDERVAATGAERERWERVLTLGRERSRRRRAGEEFPAEREREWRETGAPLFARLREHFGGSLRRATSGGAALRPETAEFLDALGLTVLGAYGMTEHLCVSFNRPERYTFDSAGPPMPGTELRIAEDGEILVRRGDLTFSGYHGQPQASTDAFTADGGWLRTGDLGELDERGFLRVRGRKKQIIALSTGKKVAPAPIEARLAEDPWIAQAMLYGDGRKYLTALLCLRRPAVERWVEGRGLAADAPELCRSTDVRERVRAAVERVNATVSPSERVGRFALLGRELSVDEGELTPTLKIRRAAVVERHRDRLDALYSDDPPGDR